MSRGLNRQLTQVERTTAAILRVHLETGGDEKLAAAVELLPELADTSDEDWSTIAAALIKEKGASWVPWLIKLGNKRRQLRERGGEYKEPTRLITS